VDSNRVVEAILFSAPKPLRVVDISNLSELAESTVRNALKDLAAEYDERGSAMEVAKVGPEYSLRLREEFSELGWKVSDKEVPETVLRTAAVIAYNQPVLQSELSKLLGPRVYDDVRTLRSLNLITSKKQGQTLLLSTNKRFAEYFGLDSTKPEDIKEWIERRSSLR
jgi:segregation and condensation protein B